MRNGRCTLCCRWWNFIVDVFSNQQAAVSNWVILPSTAGARCGHYRVRSLLTATSSDAVNRTGSSRRWAADRSCSRLRHRLVVGIEIRRCSHRQVVADDVVEVDTVITVVLLLLLSWRVINARITVSTYADTPARLHHQTLTRTAGRRRPPAILPANNSRVQVTSGVYCDGVAAVGGRTGDSDGIALRRGCAVTWHHGVQSTWTCDLNDRWWRWRWYMVNTRVAVTGSSGIIYTATCTKYLCFALPVCLLQYL